MKQQDIDRWVNRENRMNRQAAMPHVNLATIAIVIAVIGAVVFILLGAANLL